jgi:hypothetical protein
MGAQMIPTIYGMVLSCLLQTASPSLMDPKPLPELNSFLKDVRRHLHSNQTLQSNYTYTEKEIIRQLDAQNNVTKTESRVWEVYPSTEPQQTYRKLILFNDKPPSTEQMEKNDRAYDKRSREWERERARENADGKRQREAKEAEAKQKEEEELDEAFRLYQITIVGREELEGVPVIVLSFEPRANYKPKIHEGKILSKIHGRAWISEADYELVRLEAELTDKVSFGFGIFVKINKGTGLVFQRRKINNEVWLPAMSHVKGTGKILIFKDLRVDQESHYSDYKKFSVETSTEYGRVPGTSKPETIPNQEKNKPGK